MEHLSFRPTCFLIRKGMWLILAAVIAASSCVPVNISTTELPETQVNSTLDSYSSEHSEDNGLNVTHSYTEDTTLNDNNTAFTEVYNLSSNSIEDQLLKVTATLRNAICGTLCIGLDYNATEIFNRTNNSSEYLLSSIAKNAENSSFFNVGIVVAISVLVIFILAVIGGLSFFAYRHFAWNRPQTLTDKFSNDESTGYIDDSVFRENSEEMYSLDNDSFLNSLEAMTIQNYWTDHVRHTKL